MFLLAVAGMATISVDASMAALFLVSALVVLLLVLGIC